MLFLSIQFHCEEKLATKDVVWQTKLEARLHSEGTSGTS